MDERQVMRFVADADVRCEIDETVHRLSLYNLSTRGCMMDSPAGLLLTGRRVTIEFIRGVVVSGHVAWQGGHFIGVRFVVELPPVVVEFLAFRIPDPEETSRTPRDRFGRELDRLPPLPDILQAVPSETTCHLQRRKAGGRQ